MGIKCSKHTDRNLCACDKCLEELVKEIERLEKEVSDVTSDLNMVINTQDTYLQKKNKECIELEKKVCMLDSLNIVLENKIKRLEKENALLKDVMEKSYFMFIAIRNDMKARGLEDEYDSSSALGMFETSLNKAKDEIK